MQLTDWRHYHLLITVKPLIHSLPTFNLFLCPISYHYFTHACTYSLILAQKGFEQR